ncbi:hypothetical protein F0L68_33615 [Solihabitans fulvus]|uniref:Uncharacterized protein n=1 Tax=Solihabitans fulvus TaxID=1892852 RepID=A0A5B2WQN6_9PSEU|nr:hypothetical protein [Solihabitans fulvus]KAA2253090.1 hypothetical protein F0L68_33615 [Solihabitans fulvus]
MTDVDGVLASGRLPIVAAVRMHAVALWRWVTRQPATPDDVTSLSHTSDTRQLLTVLASVEIVMAPVVDLIFPKGLRIPHLVLETILAAVAFSFVATWSRHPHLIHGNLLRLRTGAFGELTLAVRQIETIRKHERKVKGFGLRAVPDEATALACTVGAKVNLLIEFADPLSVDINGDNRTVTRVYTAVDEPSAAIRAVKLAMPKRQ